jgi:hypothetical protein
VKVRVTVDIPDGTTLAGPQSDWLAAARELFRYILPSDYVVIDVEQVGWEGRENP